MYMTARHMISLFKNIMVVTEVKRFTFHIIYYFTCIVFIVGNVVSMFGSH